MKEKYEAKNCHMKHQPNKKKTLPNAKSWNDTNENKQVKIRKLIDLTGANLTLIPSTFLVC